MPIGGSIVQGSKSGKKIVILAFESRVTLEELVERDNVSPTLGTHQAGNCDAAGIIL